MLLQDSQVRSPQLPKIDAVATFQLLRGNTKGISNQYPNATGEHALDHNIYNKLFSQLMYK